MTVLTNRTTVFSRTVIAVLALSPAALFAQFAGVLPPPEQYREGFESIDLALAEQHLRYLAGPECAGRGTGQPGYMAAAAYVAAQFEEMGLEPVGDYGSFYQAVPYTRITPDPAATYLVGPNLSVKLGQGMALSRVAGNYELNGVEVVFLNISASAEKLPDELNLRDKAVVVTTEKASGATRTMLFRKRPRLVIMVVEKLTISSASVRPGVTSASANARRAPSVSIDRSIASKLADALGVDPRMVVLGHADGVSVLSAEGSGEISLKVAAKTEQVWVPNVVGYLPGSDPELSKQYIGVGAHLDHLGVRNGVVYPGADDDASGTTAMLLVAKAVTSNPVKPKRGVMFMAFCGEEMGLVGSRYYTNNPIIPLDQMVCLLQMDMVGRNEEKTGDAPEDNVDTIHLIGSKRISTELHEITLAANDHIGFKFEYDEESVYSRSDHANFARKGVPITFLFSGFHPDYHRPSDTVDKINFHKIVSAARLNYLGLEQVAGLDHVVARDVGGD